VSFPALSALAIAIRSTLTNVVELNCFAYDPQDYVARWELDNSSVVAPTDYEANWALDNSIFDSTGNHNGSTSGNMTYTVGGEEFDGINAAIYDGASYHNLPINAGLKVTNLTVCLWYKGTTHTNMLFNFGSRDTNHAGYYLFIDPNGKVFFEVGSNTGTVNLTHYRAMSSTSVITDNKWHHLCGTYNGTDVSLYVDGVLERTAVYTGGLAYASTTYGNLGTFKYWSGSSIYTMTGKLDGVKVFDYAATADQVQALSRFTLDATYNNHDGTINGTPVFGTGQIGNAMTFDGVDDYIAIPNSADLRPTQLTVSAWANASSSGVIFSSYSQDTFVAGFCLRIAGGLADFLVGKNTGGTQGVDYERATSAADPKNTWRLFTATYDGINLKLYLDAVLVDTTAWVGIAYAASNKVRIGNRWQAADDAFITGSIDDVRLYDRPLSLTEIEDIFASRNVAPPVDFIAEWKMDGDAALTDPIVNVPLGTGGLSDTSGAPLHSVTLFATIDHSTGGAISGQGYHEFNGAASYGYDNGTLTDFDSANWSHSIWVRIKAHTTPNGSGTIIDRWVSTAGGGYMLDWLTAAKKLRFLVTDGTTAQSLSAPMTGMEDDGLWHHVVITYNSSQEYKIYVDGVFGHSKTMSLPLLQPTREIRFGQRNSVVDYHFLGDMCEWSFYQRELSAAEIAGEYSQGYLYETTGLHHATPVAAPTYLAGKEGNALVLNGSTQYATVVDHADLKPSNITVSAWIKSASVPTAAHILSHYENTSFIYRGFNFRLGVTGAATLTIASNTGNVTGVDQDNVTTTTILTDDKYHLVTASYDGTTISIYVDGLLENTTTYTGGLVYSTTVPLIGAVSKGGGVLQFFNGAIDKLQLFNRAVTQAEVTAMYATTPVDCIISTSFEESVINNSPNWYWKLNETTGLIAVDSMGNDDLVYSIDANTTNFSEASSTSDGVGSSKDFDGVRNVSDPALSGSRNVGHLTGADFTIELAFDFENTNNSTNTRPPLGKWGATDANNCWSLWTSFNNFRFQMYEADGTYRNINFIVNMALLAQPIVLSGWNYISIRMDYTGTGLLTIYLNGVKASSTDVSGWSGSWRQQTSEKLWIGRDGDGDVFHGALDHVAIYQKALTDSERWENYSWWSGDSAFGVNSLEDSILLAEPEWYWKFNETTGIYAYDRMGKDLLRYPIIYPDYIADWKLPPSNAAGIGQAVDCSFFAHGGHHLTSAAPEASSSTCDLPVSGSWSVECAFSTTDLTNSQLLCGINGTANDGWYIGINQVAGYLSFNYTAGGASVRTESNNTLASYGVLLDKTDWHWVSAIVNTDTNFVKVYLDNVEVMSVDISASSQVWDSYSIYDFTIGSNRTGAINLKGGMDEFAMYYKALSDVERLRNYNWWKHNAGVAP